MRDETSQRIDAMTGEERVLVLEYFAGSDPEGFADAAAEARARARGDAPQQADVSPGRSDATCDGTDTRTRQ